MIIPFVSSLSDDVITAVPQALRDGSYGLGATRSETIRNVVFPGRAARHRRRHIAGRIARHRRDDDRRDGGRPRGQSHRKSSRGRHDRDGADRDAAVGRSGVRQPEDARRVCARPGAVLVTLALNVIALHVVRRYREQYE